MKRLIISPKDWLTAVDLELIILKNASQQLEKHQSDTCINTCYRFSFVVSLPRQMPMKQYPVVNGNNYYEHVNGKHQCIRSQPNMLTTGQ